MQAFHSLSGLDGLNELFHARLPDCVQPWREGEEAPTPVLERRSYFALFVRRARLAYEMLLHDERLQLNTLCMAWRDGERAALVDEWQRGWHAARTLTPTREFAGAQVPYVAGEPRKWRLRDREE